MVEWSTANEEAYGSDYKASTLTITIVDKNGKACAPISIIHRKTQSGRREKELRAHFSRL